MTTRSSASTSAWKAEIAEQLAGLNPAPAGPVELQIAFVIGPNRNWINLWKPAIDSLERILGSGPRTFHPQDDRITLLGMHCRVSHSLSNDIKIGLWWRNR